MDETEMREARTRAAIRVARRLGADTDQLHDVLTAVRSGWNPEVDTYGGELIGEVLSDTCDEVWQDRGEPYAPARSRRVLWVLAAMWPDVIEKSVWPQFEGREKFTRNDFRKTLKGMFGKELIESGGTGRGGGKRYCLPGQSA